MRSVLVCLILRVIAAVGTYHSVVIDNNSCGTEYFLNEEDEITLEWDGRTLSEDCWVDFKTENLETREMCFKPEKFTVFQDTGLIVEYHKDLITPQSDEEYDYYRQETDEWCDSASEIFVVFRSGEEPSKPNADIKIKARVHDDGENLEYIGYTIIGILIGVVVLVIAACVIAVICCFRKQRNRGQVFKQQCTDTLNQPSPHAGYKPQGYPRGREPTAHWFSIIIPSWVPVSRPKANICWEPETSCRKVGTISTTTPIFCIYLKNRSTGEQMKCYRYLSGIINYTH